MALHLSITWRCRISLTAKNLNREFNYENDET
jgi:hypothetical protein